MKRIVLFFIFLLLILSALWLRLNKVNWDEDTHLHPDERFLTMVGTGMKLPNSFSEYLDQDKSLLNPENVGYKFFVYGVFPLLINKQAAVLFNKDNYDAFTIQGRQLSALFDTGTVVLIFLLAGFISKKYRNRKAYAKEDYLFGLFAGFLYAINSFSIQQSHFFTVETFLNFFLTLAVFLSVRSIYANRVGSLFYLPLSAITFGFALACKIIALYFLPLIYVIIFSQAILKQTGPFKSFKLLPQLIKSSGLFLVYTVILLLVFRLLQPFYFANPNPLDFTINPITIQNFKELQGMDSAVANFPPAIQWRSKASILWPFSQIFFYGLTPLTTILAVGTIVVTVYFFCKAWLQVVQKKRYDLLGIFFSKYWLIFILLGQSTIYFLYQGTRYTMNMRYFYPIYPYLIVGAAFAAFFLIKKAMLRKTVIFLMLLTQLIWCLAFSSIYVKTQSRIRGSKWIYENIKAGEVLAFEHWDDPLPLNFPLLDNSRYSYEELPVFVYDNEEKWESIKNGLLKSDYYILSSNRAWGSLPYSPTDYPQSREYYKRLLQNQLGFVKIAEFRSRPAVSFLEFNDDLAEESFTVYDHPVVLIYKKESNEELIQAIDQIKKFR